MIKSTSFLAVTSSAQSNGLYAQQRVTDLELIVNSPAADEYILQLFGSDRKAMGKFSVTN